MPKTSLSRSLIPVSHPDTPRPLLVSSMTWHPTGWQRNHAIVVEPESLSADEQAAIRTDDGIGQVERSYREFLAKAAGSGRV